MSEYKGYDQYKKQGGPELQSFQPAGYGDNLRKKAGVNPIRGTVRKRANKRPNRGYLLALARKKGARRGYLRKQAAAARAKRKAGT